MSMLILDPDMIPELNENIALQVFFYLDAQRVHYVPEICRNLPMNLVQPKFEHSPCQESFDFLPADDWIPWLDF